MEIVQNPEYMSSLGTGVLHDVVLAHVRISCALTTGKKVRTRKYVAYEALLETEAITDPSPLDYQNVLHQV